jgi:hypothetical protein
MRRRSVCLAGVAVVALALGLLLLVDGRGAPERPAGVDRRPDVAVALPPSAAATASPSASPAPSPAPVATDQAVATARAFVVAYASYQAGDTPDSMRARLRPYDTDRFDAILGQGAAGGSGAPASGAATVTQVAVVGLAPDGRLVVTAELAAAGAARYVELYLASTPTGWRVDEVAL